jgi:hypothetical protein
MHPSGTCRGGGCHDRVIRGPGCSVRSSSAAGPAHAVLRAHPGAWRPLPLATRIPCLGCGCRGGVLVCGALGVREQVPGAGQELAGDGGGGDLLAAAAAACVAGRGTRTRGRALPVPGQQPVLRTRHGWPRCRRNRPRRGRYPSSGRRARLVTCPAYPAARRSAKYASTIAGVRPDASAPSCASQRLRCAISRTCVAAASGVYPSRSSSARNPPAYSASARPPEPTTGSSWLS